MSKRLCAIFALICVALPVGSALSQPERHATAAVSHSFKVGIADQLPNVFTDPRFLALPITHARVYLTWDTLKSPSQTAETDAWLQAAHKAGQDVLVTFTQSEMEGQHKVNPTPAQFVTQFKAMRAKWPFLKEFSTWNEVNLAGKSPAVVAKWWMALTKACPTCTILGADLVDRSPVNTKKAADPKAVASSLTTWVEGFLKATHGKKPKAWGLHDYVDANLGRTSGTKAMLKATKGSKLWLTETGGLVSRANGSAVKLPEGQAHATAATKFILTKLTKLSPAIDHVYLYEWTRSTSGWDSAFTGPENQARSSLTYLTKFLTGHSVRYALAHPSTRR